MGEISCAKKLKTSEVNVVDATFTGFVVPNGKNLNYVLEYFNNQINGLLSSSGAFVKLDGTTPLTANWNAGLKEITANKFIGNNGFGFNLGLGGNLISATTTGTAKTWTLPNTTGTIALLSDIVTAIAIKDEGTTLTSTPASLNFVGSAVTATTVGNNVTVSISGGSGSGTVTDVAALTLGTAGTDVSSSVVTSTTTPVITLNIPTASATNRGALSSANWTTFNGKIGGFGTLNYIPKFTASGTIGNSQIQDNGSVISINGGGSAATKVGILSNLTYGLTVQTTALNGMAGQFYATTSGTGDNTGLQVYAASGTGTNTGIVALASGPVGSSNYALQLVDGSEGIGKFLKSTDNIGSANWANITASDISGVVGGSGTTNYVSKFTASGTIGNSLIQDDGTNVSVNASTDVLYKFKVYTNTNDYALGGYNNKVGGAGVVGYSNGTGAQAGVVGIANSSSATMNIGTAGTAINGAIAIGVKGTASGASSVKYGAQFQDGTEGVGKFLKSITSDGKANWATLTSSDVSGVQASITLTTTGTSGAATFIGNTLNIPQYSAGSGGISLTSLTATTPLLYDNTTGVFSIQVANTSQNGYLSSTDWNTFNNKGSGTVSSVGLSMPAAFSVASSPVTGSGTIAVTGAGTVSQYVRGDGTLAIFPSSTGGGASLSFYLNGSVSQGTLGGVAFAELDKTPIFGAGTDFTIAANGYIQSFITDAGVPGLLEIPAGNWNFETYFSASSSGGTPSFYIELYKWDGATLSLIATNSATPEGITNGTIIDLYTTSLAVPQTALLVTDRLAVRIYVTNSGKTIKLHTEDSHLCQIITTFSTGLTALNGLTSQVQNLAVGTTGADFAISSTGTTHTFNLPTASATNRGALSSANWTTFNSKVDGTGTTNYLSKFTASGTIGNSQIQDDGTTLAIGATPVSTAQFKINTSAARHAITVDTNYTGTGNYYSFYGVVNGVRSSDSNVAIRVEASNSTIENTGGIFISSSAGTATGYGVATYASNSGTGLTVGGRFSASGTSTQKYSLELVDGTETVAGRFLKNIVNGRANWATLTEADISGFGTYAKVGTYTNNYVTKWNATTNTLANSLIQDNGTYTAIGAAPSSTAMLRVAGSAGAFYGIYSQSIFTGGVGGTFIGTNGVKGDASGNGVTSISRGGEFNATDSVVNIGVVGAAGVTTYASTTNIGGQFVASDATTNYAVQLIDGSEGIAGRFLKDVTGSGHANWATLTVANTGLTITTTGSGAATLVGNTLNIPQTSGFNYGLSYAMSSQNILL